MTSTGADAAAADRHELGRGLTGAAIAVCAWSTGTVITKHIDMGGLAIGAYRFSVFAIGIILWMEIRRTPFRWPAFRDSIWGGLALGLDIAFFFSAVKLTSVVNATIIGSLQPVVVGVVAARFFHEHIRPRDALWSLVAIAGAIVVVVSGSGEGESSWKGNLLAVGAMFAWSGYFIASKRSKDYMTSTEFTAGTAVWTAIICTPLALLFDQDLSFPSATNWFWLFAMIIGSGIVGHALMNWSLVRIPLWVGSTFTLLIPVFAAVLAWVFLDEGIEPAQIAAMAVVIGALSAIVYGQRRQVVAEIAAEEVVA
ncbi:MAG: DMT family transporter [Acidimicrobiia bacterium]|nr:DMT family transporter [Acidimicrobiia bacterium]